MSSIAIAERFHEQEQQAAERIRSAVEKGERLRIAGGDSRTFLGRSIEADDTLSSLPFSGILSYEPSELVLRVGAGTRVSDIQNLLAEQNQCLAFEPHCLNDGASTIGGSIASAMAGAARPWQGGVKDHVLGLGLINGKGDILKFGGQVMKNVAGYDVSRAMVGSLGCMGLMTELSLKVLPVAAHQFFVQKPCGLQEALELAAKLDEGMTMRNGFAWSEGMAHIRFAGPEEAVFEVFKGFALDAYALKSDGLWDQLSKMSHGIFSGDGSLKLWRIVAPKYTNLSGLFDGKPLLMNWAGGEYFVRSSDEAMHRIKSELGELGAHAYSYHLDQTYVLQGLSPAVERLHIALKQAFDPHGVFNPGRMSEAF